MENPLSREEKDALISESGLIDKLRQVGSPSGNAWSAICGIFGNSCIHYGNQLQLDASVAELERLADGGEALDLLLADVDIRRALQLVLDDSTERHQSLASRAVDEESGDYKIDELNLREYITERSGQVVAALEKMLA
tara:strand:- start:1733 stop:2146 length:414 start_codon:yes stop_codon:yes gene_type:complete